jgi:hypothetical protein
MTSEAAYLLHERLAFMVGTTRPTREQVRAAIRAALSLGIDGVTMDDLVVEARTIELQAAPPPIRRTP